MDLTTELEGVAGGDCDGVDLNKDLTLLVSVRRAAGVRARGRPGDGVSRDLVAPIQS